ncbi:ribonuclease p mrp subunit rpp1 [Fusarium heterosporum]|uniref:Ribonuclease p mrp subunit rpp1 n=1 Tax=Fusarium heterosporum TaxID=42747 RepID=A0A8H5T6G5_FUSHE|nr:ribonuclease p mrp subunit rpp1 [Fusarium heterosporum]
MLYDLNIAWSPATTQDQLLQTLTLSSSLGYSTVALNHTLTLPLPANLTAPFPTLPPSPTSKLPNVLHRATLPLSDPSANNYRIPFLTSTYDIIAARPLTDKAFQNACLTLDVPIISMDFTQHLQFHFKPKPCMAAVSRGIRFEVCYSQALSADTRGRANFISNVTNLIRATRGRGLMISSEAKDALSLRAPADVVNLLSVWGLGNEKGMQGLGEIPRSVVVNEGIKRNGFRGVINIVEVAEQVTEPDDGENGKVSAGKKNKNKAQNQNQKRKNGEEEPQQVSKRQAKKMKLASRVAGAEKKSEV